MFDLPSYQEDKEATILALAEGKIEHEKRNMEVTGSESVRIPFHPKSKSVRINQIWKVSDSERVRF